MLYKKLLLFIGLPALLMSQKAADIGRSFTYDDGEIDVLNGHVKQIVALRQSPLGNRFMDTVITVFDKKGRETKVITETPLGKRSKDELINSYNKNGEITETRIAGSPIKGIYRSRKDGWTVTVHFSPNDPQGSENLYKYDAEGYLIELDYSEKPNVLTDIIKYQYDKSHRLIETDQRSAKGELKLKKTFEYKLYVVDAKKNWIKAKVITKEIYPSFTNKRTKDLTRKITYY